MNKLNGYDYSCEDLLALIRNTRGKYISEESFNFQNPGIIAEAEKFGLRPKRRDDIGRCILELTDTIKIRQALELINIDNLNGQIGHIVGDLITKYHSDIDYFLGYSHIGSKKE